MRIRGGQGRISGLPIFSAICAVFLLAACEEGPFAPDPPPRTPGTATVTGTVAAMEWGAVSPKHADGGQSIVVPAKAAGTAPAAAGIEVSVAGTGLATTTDDGGNFTLAGVPAGRVELRFSSGTMTGELVLDVPPGVTVQLRNVRVTAAGVSVDDILIVETTVAQAGAGGAAAAAAAPPAQATAGSGNDDSREDDEDDGEDEGDEDEGEEDD
jgi:ribosomal protein L12E/L44/L45/RPP1/RPP2